MRAEAWRTASGDEVELDLGLELPGREGMSGLGSLLGGGE
jgi:hypothetical protein